MKKKLIIALAICVLSINASLAQTHHHHHKNIHDIIPAIGISGAHTHQAKEIMLSYKYMNMKMKDSNSGSKKISTAKILETYMMAPTEMEMQMHMIGSMFAPNNKVTFMGMLPYIDQYMTSQKKKGNTLSRMKTKGLGDIKITALFPLDEAKQATTHLHLGLSFPTGKINKKGESGKRMAYAMQLGSGTYDIDLGMTYIKNQNKLQYGLQNLNTIRLNRNKYNYRLGNRYEATTWVAKKINKQISISTRLKGKIWGNISGQDTDLNMALGNNMSPAITTNKGGKQLDVLIGASYQKEKITTAIELGVPIMQDLNGIQLRRKLNLNIGMKKTL
eukprot:COSAG01_NODE_52_length_31456_cov_125.226648_33_plen_332_part_00